MPNRIIKDSINESKGLSMCSVFAEDLYKRLITYADDYGRFNADTEIMLARLYPRELFCITQEDIVEALMELAGNNKIAFYTAKVFNATKATSGVYGCFPNWNEHQRVRDSKRKCPDPENTNVNDWYLRRFIPLDMKAQIVERDGFKCRICGKFVTSCRDAKRFVKLGSGMYHIDHIVPCNQGGRATPENLQLTCPTCNLSRKKHFSFEEIVKFSENSEQAEGVAETCGNSPQLAALIQSNPIQSESNTNPNTESGMRACAQTPAAIVQADFLNRINSTPSPSSLDALAHYAEQMGVDVCKRAFDIALDNKKTSWSYIRAILADKLSKGVKCLADWDELDKKHEQEKKTQPRGNKNPNSMVGMDFQPNADRIRKNAESLDKLLAETRGDFDGR